MAVNAVAVGELPSNELFAVRRNRRMNPSPSDEAVEVVWYDTPQKLVQHFCSFGMQDESASPQY